VRTTYVRRVTLTVVVDPPDPPLFFWAAGVFFDEPEPSSPLPDLRIP
jgi:hypothetical protein